MSNSNFRPGNIIQGQPMPAVSASFNLTSNNQFLQVSEFSLIYLSSDSTSAAQRIFTIQNGNKSGQKLIIEFVSGGGTLCTLASSSNVFLSGNWTPVQYQTIELMWDEVRVKWVQLGVDGSGPNQFNPIINNPTDGNIIVYDYSSSEWTNQGVNGDALMTGSGDLNIPLLHYAQSGGQILVSDVNGDMQQVSVSGDVTLSPSGDVSVTKLHGSTPAKILIADGSGDMQQVSMSGGATISTTGVVTLNGAFPEPGGGFAGGDVLVYNGTNDTWNSVALTGDASIIPSGDLTVTKLHGATSGQILAADVSGVMQQVSVSGDATISSSGSLSVSKLHGASEAQILVADGSGNMQQVTMSGDGTISSAGVLTLNAGLSRYTINLNHSDILTLNASPFAILPSPPANYFYLITNIVYITNFSVGYDYTAVTRLNIQYNGTSGIVVTTLSPTIMQGVGTYAFVFTPSVFNLYELNATSVSATGGQFITPVTTSVTLNAVGGEYTLGTAGNIMQFVITYQQIAKTPH